MADTILQQIDGQLDKLFAGWNVYSTCVAVLLIVTLFFPLFFASEADTHPLLLARQAVPSAVRRSGESAVYRSLETPHGYPLRSGLDIRDPGNPRWAQGRDGDLRDIWNEVLRKADSSSTSNGRFISIKGRLDPVTHDLQTMSKNINIVGKYLQAQGVSRVALYLPNSVEFITTFFAAVYYGIVPILIERNQSIEVLTELLTITNADTLIAPAGVLAPTDIEKASPKLKHIIWVVEQESRHMGWDDGPIAGRKISELDKIIDQNEGNATAELPSTTFETGLPSIVSIWQNQDKTSYEVVNFSQKNIVAAVAAQIHALPRPQRMTANDVFLSLEAFSHSYALTLFLAALFSHSTIALTTSTGYTPDFALAFQRVNPSIVVASSETLSDEHARRVAAGTSILQKAQHVYRYNALAAGSMPHANPAPPTVQSSPTSTTTPIRGPRLIYTSARANADSTPLSPAELGTLRVFTGSHIVHALTAPIVAGAVAQTNMMDYRTDMAAKRAHFGPPLSALELKLVEGLGETIPDDMGDADPAGVLVASGPAVVGGEANLRVRGTFGNDNCLVLI